MQKVQFKHFYTYSELEVFLKETAEQFPQYVKLETLAVTDEGREVFLAKITDFSSGENAEKKGAYYVQSGMHASEGAGTTAALHFIESLLSLPNKDKLFKELVFYIIPRMNPDGVEYSITKCALIRSKFEKIDGLPNAIIPTDLNNDGMILQMRVKNPLGNMVDYQSTGIMLARSAEDVGPFYDVYTEGIIKDYDGGSPKLGMRSLDFNRSFPSSWLPLPNSEDYPCRGTETRAVAEFMVTHQNIFACIDYHCGSCGILRPLMSSDATLNQTDRHTIVDIGKLAQEMTGLPLIHEREYKEPDDIADEPYGCSNEWAYHALGISSYVIELGNGFNGIGLKTADILKKWRTVENGEWMSSILERHKTFSSDILVPWQTYEHDQLGIVEIGGLKDGLAYYMYPPDMEQVIPKTTSFLLRHAAMRPRLILGNAQKTDIGGGNYRIRVDCMNTGHLGTTVMVGAEGYNAQKDISIKLNSDSEICILSRPAQYMLQKLDSMQKESLEWFVKGKSGDIVTLTASHPKCGQSTLTIEL